MNHLEAASAAAETAVVKATEAALTGTGVLLSQFESDSAEGGEQFDSRAMAVPFLTIGQALSPWVKEEDASYIDGAKPGMILNTVTKRLYDTRILQGKPKPAGIPVVFAGEKFVVVEWKPDRGGFVAQHPLDSPVVKSGVFVPVEGKDRPAFRTPQGNELVETDYYYPIIVEDPSNPSWGVIGMSVTQLSDAKKLNTLVDGLRLGPNKFKPMWYHLAFILRTEVKQKKGSNQTWWGWNIEYVGDVNYFGDYADAIYKAAKAYRSALDDGLASQVKPPVDGTPSTREDIPF